MPVQRPAVLRTSLVTLALVLGLPALSTAGFGFSPRAGVSFAADDDSRAVTLGGQLTYGFNE